MDIEDQWGPKTGPPIEFQIDKEKLWGCICKS